MIVDEIWIQNRIRHKYILQQSLLSKSFGLVSVWYFEMKTMTLPFISQMLKTGIP